MQGFSIGDQDSSPKVLNLVYGTLPTLRYSYVSYRPYFNLQHVPLNLPKLWPFHTVNNSWKSNQTLHIYYCCPAHARLTLEG